MKEKIICKDCISNKSVQIDLTDSSIQSIKHLTDQCSGDLYMGPGLTDIQINGFIGVDYNTYPIEEEGILKTIHALLAEGVCNIFPTVITNSDAKINLLLENIDRLCRQNPLIEQCIGGIHLEGPFISPMDGARGAHDIRYIKAPDWDLFKEFQQSSGNRIKIITLCPKWENADYFIKKCVENGIVVSIGHTNASPDRIRDAVKSGATLSTHLGNGAPLMLPRNSNFIIEQLAHDQLYSSLIADGFHLPDSFLKIVLEIKQDRSILISDSTMFACMKDGVYDSHIGGKVVLEKSGRLSMYSNQKLMAGAASSILDGINKLIKSRLTDLQNAWACASINPNKIVNLSNDYLRNPETSDLVVFKLENRNISIIAVFKNGKRVYFAN